MTRPLPLTKPRCPDCRRPLVLDRGVYECQRCGVGWVPAAIIPNGKPDRISAPAKGESSRAGNRG